MEQKVKMEIPNDIVAHYLSGEYDISKAVVRNNDNGQIVRYIDLEPYNEDRSDPSRCSGGTAKQIAGVAVLSLVVIGLITYIVRIKKQKKNLRQIEVPANVVHFNEVFKLYLKEATDGQVNIATVCELIQLLDEIEQNGNGSISIDLTTQEMQELLNIMLHYTEQLYEQKHVDLSKMKITIFGDNQANPLKEYLLLQKAYLEEIA